MNNICLSRFNYVTQIMGFCYYHPYQNNFWSNESLTQNYVRSNLHSCFLFLVATGYYNTIQLLEAITLHLDSVNGKPCIWEELVLCFLRLFAAKTADYEDCISCTNTQWDEALDVFSKFSSFFFERFSRESWKARCIWWMHHHFGQNAYASETLTGSCLFLKFIHLINNENDDYYAGLPSYTPTPPKKTKKCQHRVMLWNQHICLSAGMPFV
jgi:hypothetical protein